MSRNWGQEEGRARRNVRPSVRTAEEPVPVADLATLTANADKFVELVIDFRNRLDAGADRVAVPWETR